MNIGWQQASRTYADVLPFRNPDVRNTPDLHYPGPKKKHDDDNGVSTREKRTALASDARSVWRGRKPAANRLPRGEPRHLHARVRAGPIDDRDGASARVVVRGVVRLRLLRDDPVARSAAGVDDARVQDVRAERGDVEERRVGGRRAARSAARAAPREGPED